jgi:hypothetical protein
MLHMVSIFFPLGKKMVVGIIFPLQFGPLSKEKLDGAQRERELGPCFFWGVWPYFLRETFIPLQLDPITLAK